MNSNHVIRTWRIYSTYLCSQMIMFLYKTNQSITKYYKIAYSGFEDLKRKRQRRYHLSTDWARLYLFISYEIKFWKQQLLFSNAALTDIEKKMICLYNLRKDLVDQNSIFIKVNVIYHQHIASPTICLSTRSERTKVCGRIVCIGV